MPRSASTCDDHATSPERAGRALVAEQYRVGLVGINDDRDNYIAGCTECGGVGAGNASLAFKLLQHFRTHVACVGAESGPQQRARDTEAHGTKTDDSNWTSKHNGLRSLGVV
jgi:hypothetical protein